MANLTKVFNDHFEEFVGDIHNVFPDDVDIVTAKNALLTMRKANPKLIPQIWTTYIVGPYKSQIEAGDLSFFIEKDYSQDVSNSKSSEKIMSSINRLREPIRQMSDENKAKTLKYIQNLTKLSLMIN